MTTEFPPDYWVERKIDSFDLERRTLKTFEKLCKRRNIEFEYLRTIYTTTIKLYKGDPEYIADPIRLIRKGRSEAAKYAKWKIREE